MKSEADTTRANLKGLNAFAAEVHENAVGHGWWEKPQSFGETIALIHSELSEALEAYRNGEPLAYVNGKNGEQETVPSFWTPDEKPEGAAVELADAIIRILDWAAYAGVDMEELLARKHQYNKGRSYRHGGKIL